MISFSVIIPTYNRKNFLFDCLETVFAQTYQPFEVIVIDDGSTDGTIEALEKFLGRIQVIGQANAGPGTARNRGAAAASGRYLAFLDSDDLWFPWTLETFAEVIEKQASPPFLVGTNTYFKKTDISENNIAKKEINYTIYHSFFAGYNDSKIGVPTHAVSIRRDVFKRVGGFSDSFVGEDLFLWLRLGCEKPFIHITQPCLAAQRIHEKSVTGDMKKTLDGIKSLLTAEKRGVFPGGNEWRLVREDRLATDSRSASIRLARSNFFGACQIYFYSFALNLKSRRYKYLIIAPIAILFIKIRGGFAKK